VDEDVLKRNSWQHGKASWVCADEKGSRVLGAVEVGTPTATALSAELGALACGFPVAGNVAFAVSAAVVGYAAVPGLWAIVMAAGAPWVQRKQARQIAMQVPALTSGVAQLTGERDQLLVERDQVVSDRDQIQERLTEHHAAEMDQLQAELDEAQQRADDALERLARRDRLRALALKLRDDLRGAIQPTIYGWSKRIAHDQQEGRNTNLEKLAEAIDRALSPIAATLRDEGEEFGLHTRAADFEPEFDWVYNPPTPNDMLARLEAALPTLDELVRTIRDEWWGPSQT
jgi:hypothetical protein